MWGVMIKPYYETAEVVEVKMNNIERTYIKKMFSIILRLLESKQSNKVVKILKQSDLNLSDVARYLNKDNQKPCPDCAYPDALRRCEKNIMESMPPGGY